MTEKLYTADAYCREFDAVVLSCSKNKDRYEVILDRSCFYPEGGGQPGDHGTLTIIDETARSCTDEEIYIYDTHEHDDHIIHYAKTPMAEGTRVHGCIDWEYRFDLMQNHSGEHIVSGLLHERFGCNNVGFHMGADMITIDLDCEITWEELMETELAANRIIWNNNETKIHTYSHEEAAGIEYRSKKEIPGDIRIVTFEGADTCACCGTHVKRTGEIGLIRILSVMKFHDGVRIEMLCGRRAFLYSQAISAQNKSISVLLSAKPTETAAAAARVKDAAANADFRALEMESRLFEMYAKQYAQQGNILVFGSNYAPDSVRKLAVAIMETCGGICAVFSAAQSTENGEETDWKYAVGHKDGNVKELVTVINKELNGRGGGKPFFAQGSCRTDRESIIRAIQADEGWTIVY